MKSLYQNNILWIAIICDLFIQLVVALIINNSDSFIPDNQSSNSYIYPIIFGLIVFPIIVVFSIFWNLSQVGLVFYFIYSCSRINYSKNKDLNSINLLSGLLCLLYVPLIIYKFIFLILLLNNGISSDSYKNVFPEKQGVLIDAFYDKKTLE